MVWSIWMMFLFVCGCSDRLWRTSVTSQPLTLHLLVFHLLLRCMLLSFITPGKYLWTALYQKNKNIIRSRWSASDLISIMYLRVGRFKVKHWFKHGCQFGTEMDSDWPQMGQISEYLHQHASQNVLKGTFKIARFLPFCVNLTSVNQRNKPCFDQTADTER